MNIGSRFIQTEDRNYTQDGIKGVHHTEVMYEVTALTGEGFDAKAVEVVSESGRPRFAGTPTGRKMAWFGWDAAIKRGDVKEV